MNESCRILFVDASTTRSSPATTWAKALTRAGASCRFIDLGNITTADWISLSRKNDAIIAQLYGAPSPHVARMLAVSAANGCPVIRKWSGSDSLYCLQDKALAQAAKALDSIVALNLTSEHQGIVDELASIGIDAELTEQVVSDMVDTSTDTRADIPTGALVYLPTERKTFYGIALVEPVIARNPNIQFTVVADTDHYLGKYSNVRSLGWISNMEEVWPMVGIMIRVTAHDGFPRSIVEALARGRHVIHNQHIPACMFAQTTEDIEKQLKSFLAHPNWNLAGTQAMRSAWDGTNDAKLLNAIRSARVTAGQRLLAAARAFLGKARARVRKRVLSSDDMA